MELAPATPLPKAPEDPEATLPWDRAPGRGRASPDGGREAPQEAGAGPKAGDEEAAVVVPHVFVPIDPQCIEQSPGKDKKQQEEGKGGDVPRSQHPLLLPVGPSRSRDPWGLEGRAAKACREGARCPWAKDCGRGNLKAVASVLGALLLCPCFVYGAYVFLPFDAPLLPTISTRLVYTLRCAAFATVPIVLGEQRGAQHHQRRGCCEQGPIASHRLLLFFPAGMLVSGIARLCSSALEPFGELQREVEIHRTFVAQSGHLFILYFFNMAVLATYLPQELLKLIPLLTGLFALSR